MSTEGNTRLFERAAEMIEADVAREDLDMLYLHVCQAEKASQDSEEQDSRTTDETMGAIHYENKD